jgi:hypothetical protein
MNETGSDCCKMNRFYFIPPPLSILTIAGNLVINEVD